MILKHDDFENLLDFKFSQKMKDVIDSLQINITPLSQAECKKQVQNIEDVLDLPPIVAGAHRISDWNNGWNENNLEFEKTRNYLSLIPKYFNKYNIVRFNNQLYKINSNNSELNMLRVLQYFILEKYCINVQNFYEFGCGTGHNLFAISELEGNSKNYFGFDWSNPPRNIFENIKTTYNKNFYFDNFDFFNPNNDVNINDNSAVFTFAALEQIGDKHEKFINFLIEKKPSICIHLEPIIEMLDPNDKLQNLSIKYIQKRNYLSNFYSSLINLEKQQKIEIIDADRTTIGSYFIEGYSLVAWKVK